MEHSPLPLADLRSNTQGSDFPAAVSRSHDLVPLLVPRDTTDLKTDLQVAPLLHKHPLIPFTRFVYGLCKVCNHALNNYFYIYGGYRCNEVGWDCQHFVFHKECANPVQELNHYSHPQHSLKLIIQDLEISTPCTICGIQFNIGYCCSICDFKLDLRCAKRPEPIVLPQNVCGHEHPLQIFRDSFGKDEICGACSEDISSITSHYRCLQCGLFIHLYCVDLFPEAYHSSHPQHPLKSLQSQVPHYADERCLLCGTEFDESHHQLHHCDVCNFSICRACMLNPPPVDVECLRTHEHRLHLVPRRINFTCNACGTQGDRSPYFCLQCNFMIHRECIGLPRVININRHDHRIAYTCRLGHGEWKCRVCRESVDGFYGGYTCNKCPSLVVHSLCATDKQVWDMVEREGTPEEEEIAPFEVIDDTTIKHFSHDHNLRIYKNSQVLPESTLCVACVFQICSEPFYSCEQCNFILHEKCAQLPRKKRHMSKNQPFTLLVDALGKAKNCLLCHQDFSGFKYKGGFLTALDVRCALSSDSIEHKSHEHPLYYYFTSDPELCSHCGKEAFRFFRCTECDYVLDAKCALLPEKVMKKRYDDHPLFLYFGDKDADGVYWCEACETKLDPKKWFYTCNDYDITLHISCVVGDFSYIMPGAVATNTLYGFEGEVVSDNSICRPICYVCKSRCNLPCVRKLDVYICSLKCRSKYDDDHRRI